MTRPLFASEHIEITEDDRDCWCTPDYVIDRVVLVLDRIDLDPCSNQYSKVPALTKWTRAHDGLSQDWSEHRTVYCNPPYSDPDPWMFLCSMHPTNYAGRKPAEVIACIKSDTSTQWWHRRIWKRAAAICFPSKRIEFTPPPGIQRSSPDFATALVYYGQRPLTFDAGFADIGHIDFPGARPR